MTILDELLEQIKKDKNLTVLKVSKRAFNDNRIFRMISKGKNGLNNPTLASIEKIKKAIEELKEESNESL